MKNYFGANLLQYILPENKNQPLIKVAITPPDGGKKDVNNGIFAEDEVLAGIRDAQAKINSEKPDTIITNGGNCLVSLASFDYLHGLYEKRELAGLMLTQMSQRLMMVTRTPMRWYWAPFWGMGHHSLLNR